MTEEQKQVLQRLQERFGEAHAWETILPVLPAEILKDMQLNLFRVLDGELAILVRADRMLIASAVASVCAAPPALLGWLQQQALLGGKTQADVDAARAAAMTVSMYNGYYKFRAMMEGPGWDAFQPALRATPFVRSALTKQLIELICVAVSVQNTCTHCLQGHVRSASEAGATPAMLDEVVRLGAVIGALSGFRAA